MKTAVAIAAPPEDRPEEVLLHADGISLARRSSRGLSDISIRVCSGEIIGLLGPNGAGKSTLLSVLSGQLKPEAGSITLCGADVTSEGRRNRQKRGLAVCTADARHPMLVQLAAAISSEPKVVCLDEPFNGVAPMSSVHAALAALIETLKTQGCGVVVADHNVQDSLRFADRAYLMYEGKILRDGTRDFLMGEADNKTG
jgi:lipopolysaccharide export system ATP-binding protein